MTLDRFSRKERPGPCVNRTLASALHPRKRPGVGQDKISVLVAIIYPLVPVKFYKYAECARSLRPYLRLSARLLTARGTRLILFDLPDVRKELQLNAPEANLTPLKISKAALAYPAIDH